MSAVPGTPFPDPKKYGFAGRLASFFIDSKLTPILVAASLLLGFFAVLMLPREEEPQIKVPMMDVMVAMPGASAAEVESRVTRPMEKFLWEIAGVEYLYSTASPGGDMTVVRFKVGTDLEAALVRLNQKLQANFDRIPLGVGQPLIKPRTIDDVPILALTFHSSRYDHNMLRRLATQVDDAVKQIPLVAETNVIGGERRAIRILIDPQRLASRGLSPAALVPVLQHANSQVLAGAQSSGNRETLLQAGSFFRDARDVGSVVGGSSTAGRSISATCRRSLTGRASRELCAVGRQPHGVRRAAARPPAGAGEPAVTISVAKRQGVNAIDVVGAVLAKIETLKGTVIPGDVAVSVTRNYGETAAEKSGELLFHMGIAVFGVTLLIVLFLGWRESLVVLVAIPVTLADPAGLLPLRIHAQPHHAVRADLLDRHSGGRRDRGRREHRPPHAHAGLPKKSV